MVETQLNIFDSIIIGIMLLSSLLGFFRGFIREILSLGAWLGAAVLTIYFFNEAAEFAKHYIKNEKLAAGAGGAGLYITALVCLSILNAIIVRYLKTGTEVGVLDNMLGLIFGIARAAFIISLGFLILAFTLGEKQDYP